MTFLSPTLTQHHYTEKIIETKVKGEAKTVTDTQIVYIPKEIIPPTGQLEKTDLDAQIGKQEINIKLNGKEVAFKKTDDEQFALEKNKIALTQKSEIVFDVKVEPPIIDKTKRWNIGVGYSSNGPAGKIDFPLGENERFGGWVYGDGETKAVGVGVRF